MLLRRDVRPGQPRLRACMVPSVAHPFMLARTAASVELSVILNQGMRCPPPAPRLTLQWGVQTVSGHLECCGVARFACRRVQASLQSATLGLCLVFAGLFSRIHICGVV